MSIEYEITDTVVTITINRPDAMNALDEEHNQALADAWADFETDPNLRVAILTGAGTQAFSAGADLKHLIPSVRSRVRAGESPPWAFGGITASPTGGLKPTIAAINGHALAGGLELALACDIRIATENARFGLAETRWAIIPGAGGTQRLPRIVGAGLAMQMILSAEPIDAPAAERAGLISEIVTQEDLGPRARTLARTIASRGPLAIRAAKNAVLNGIGRTFEEGLLLERNLFYETLRTDDAVEGATAFTEKRDPVYVGA